MNIASPVLSASEEAKFHYQQNTWAKASDNTRKAAFDADSDTFMLDERLLKLGLIWQWRELKGLPYAEDMQNYEMLQAKLIAADKGSRTIRIGTPRLPAGDELAYPWSIQE